MSAKRLFGWGIAIYAILALAGSGAAAYGLAGTFWASLIELAVLVATCIIAGSSLKFRSWKDILPYSLGWAGIAILLDALIAVPLTGWQLYSQWSAWVGYALVALLPLLSVIFKTQRTPAGVWES